MALVTKEIVALGLDFGSSSTTLVGKTESGDIVFFKQVKYNDNLNRNLPTAYAEKGNGEYELFSDAISKDNAKWSLKEDLVSSVQDEEACKAFFKGLLQVVENYKEFDGTDDIKYSIKNLKKIVFGHPAYLDEAFLKRYCKNLANYIAEAFAIDRRKTEIVGLAEPYLAGYTYYKERNNNAIALERGKMVLILDLGGYTVDMSLMKIGVDGIKKCKISCSKSNGLLGMGKQLTSEISDCIKPDMKFDPRVDEAKCQLFEKHNIAKPEDIERLEVSSRTKYGGIEFKLHYTAEGVPDIDEDGCIHIGLTKCDGRSNNVEIEEKAERLVEQVKAYLMSVLDEYEKEVSYILFSGGGARIKIFRDAINKKLFGGKIKELFIDDLKGDLKAEDAVAYGACLAAAGDCEKTTRGIEDDNNGRQDEVVKDLQAQIDILEQVVATLSSVATKDNLNAALKRFENQ